VLLVVFDLQTAATHRFADRTLHRVGDLVGVHDDLAIDVSSRTPNHLNQRGLATKEAFLVRVENRHERHLGKIETLSQQVDPNEHIELTQTQVSQDLDSFERVHLGMQIPNTQAQLEQIVGEVFGHLLRQRRDQHALIKFSAFSNHLNKIIDLTLGRPHDDLGVDQTRRAHDLLHNVVRYVKLIGPRCCRQEHHLVHHFEPLVETQRPVVDRGRQTKTMLDQNVLTAPVAGVLAMKLRDGHVRLIEHHQIVVGEVIEQRKGTLSRRTPVEVHRIVLNAVAIPDLSHHLEVVLRAHPKTLRLEQLALFLERRKLELQLLFDTNNGLAKTLLACDIVRRRENTDVLERCDSFPGQRIDTGNRLDLIAKHLDSHDGFVVRRMNLDGVATNAEFGTHQVHVVALVLHIDKLAKNLSLIDLLANVEGQQQGLVLLGRTQTINARN